MDWDNLIEEAADATDTALTGKISSLCRLTDEEINAIAPDKIDKENLVQILSIVKDAALSNEKKAEAVKNVGNSLSILIGIAAKVA